MAAKLLVTVLGIGSLLLAGGVLAAGWGGPHQQPAVEQRPGFASDTPSEGSTTVKLNITFYEAMALGGP